MVAHITTNSMSTFVYDGLRRRIVDVDLKPGDMLVEQKLAAEFGVSRTPIREVLVRLASEGMVEILPNRGSMVAPIRVEAVKTAQFVRESLEISVALVAAQNMTSLAELKLRQAIEEQDLANREGNADLFYQSDEAMHFKIAEIAGLPLVWNYTEEAKIQMDRVRRLSLIEAHSFDGLIAQHQRIVDAIAQNDEQEIADSLKEHLRQVLPDLEALRESRPNFFRDAHRKGQALSYG